MFNCFEAPLTYLEQIPMGRVPALVFGVFQVPVQ
jgi:hypothetical protein